MTTWAIKRLTHIFAPLTVLLLLSLFPSMGALPKKAAAMQGKTGHGDSWRLFRPNSGPQVVLDTRRVPHVFKGGPIQDADQRGDGYRQFPLKRRSSLRFLYILSAETYNDPLRRTICIREQHDSSPNVAVIEASITQPFRWFDGFLLPREHIESRRDKDVNRWRLSSVPNSNFESYVASTLVEYQRTYDFGIFDEDPWPISQFELSRRRIRRAPGGLRSFVAGSPLQVGINRIANVGQQNEEGGQGDYCIRMLRVGYPTPNYPPNLGWVWLCLGMLGALIAVHGLASIFVGYLAFGCPWASRVLTKGIALLIVGSVVAHIGPYKRLNGPFRVLRDFHCNGHVHAGDLDSGRER
jgi:hypothetical protein